MIIDNTSDKIQFKLGASVTTSQLTFTVDYNNYSSTAVTPSTNNGVSNNVTAVDLVTSPASSQQNELRYCSINNTDTVNATVKILVYDGSNTRTVFQAVLAPGDLLQYQLEKGWEIIDSIGLKKINNIQSFAPSLRTVTHYRPGSISAASTLVSGTWNIIKIGRAEKAYTTINVVYNVTTLASTITWAEIAIYSCANLPDAQNVLAYRAGTANIASVITSTGIKNTAISVSGINPAEALFLVIGVSATTPGAMRSQGWADDAGNTYFGNTVVSATNSRPSLLPTAQLTAGNGLQIQIMWQGT